MLRAGGRLLVCYRSPVMDTGSGWLSARLDRNTVIVQVRRDVLSAGDYSGRVNVQSNGGDASIEVRLSVGTAPPANVDTLYVIALDPFLWETQASATATRDTPFRYELPPVSAGQYLITAGTDLDDDGYICDAGEYCGWYPVGSDATLVRVLGNQTTRGVSFTVEEDNSRGYGASGPRGSDGFSILPPARSRLPEFLRQPRPPFRMKSESSKDFASPRKAPAPEGSARRTVSESNRLVHQIKIGAATDR